MKQIIHSSIIISEVKEALINEKIKYSEAWKIIKSNPKPWQRTEWKETRKKIIKDYCEVCGSKEGPMVLQHNSHQQNFGVLYNIFFNSLLSKEIDVIEKEADIIRPDEIQKLLNKYSELKKCCPEYGSHTLRDRKNITPHYICAKGHAFDIPEENIYYAKFKTGNPDLVNSKARIMIRDQRKNLNLKRLKEKYDEEIGRLALIELMDQSEEYMKMTDIKTCC
ncbi:MAG: hypothetical protein JRJ57_08340 [Deltaproteobacteria bacterium]|nr:hypothetical protein [Deltaproteobacteria bacterium]